MPIQPRLHTDAPIVPEKQLLDAAHFPQQLVLVFDQHFRGPRTGNFGSGVRKVNLYLPRYAPGAGKPVFEDGDMFKVTVPLTVTGPAQVTPEVMTILSVLEGEMSRADIQRALHLRNEKHFRENYQQVAVALGLIEMTMPDKPTSRLQKYRLTDKGRAVLERGEEV